MKYPLIDMKEIPDKGSIIVPFFGREVHVYKVDGKARAVANTCLHFGGPLEFDAAQCQFSCPWHNATYDASNGKPLDGPAPSQARLMFLSTIVEDEKLTYIWGE